MSLDNKTKERLRNIYLENSKLQGLASQKISNKYKKYVDSIEPTVNKNLVIGHGFYDDEGGVYDGKGGYMYEDYMGGYCEEDISSSDISSSDEEEYDYNYKAKGGARGRAKGRAMNDWLRVKNAVFKEYRGQGYSLKDLMSMAKKLYYK